MRISVGYTQSDRANGYSSFDGYLAGAQQTVIEFEAHAARPLTAEQVAEAVFMADNAPYDLNGLAADIRTALQSPDVPRHHSLSVGDTVAVDGVHLACASMGWVPVAEADRETREFLTKIGVGR